MRRIGSRPIALLVVGLTFCSRASAAQEPDFTERARAHYARVGAELEARGLAHLDSTRRAARAGLIAALADYAERGDFGVNRAFAGARVPHFVDDDGRRCAVAHLLHVCGEDELVAHVARDANHAFVAELANEPALARWLDAVGLDFEEAVRIQVPTGPTGLGAGTGSSETGDGDGGAGAPSSPARPSPGGPNRPGAAAPATGGRSAPSATPPRSPAPGAPDALTPGESAWWIWWEMNKLEYLRPNRLSLLAGPATAYDFGAGLADELAAPARAELAQRLIAELRHPAAEVRAAAVIALARTRGADAVLFALPLLRDASVQVREHALLALGAAGGERAAELLFAIARDGSESEERRDEIAPRARALALIALGLARRQGLDSGMDTRVAELFEDERDERALAAMLYRTLAPDDALAGFASALAVDGSARIETRARALETLSTSAEPQALALLTRELHGRRAELRRSAALALGASSQPLASATLKTAFELEKEATTRGFALLGVGEHGGADARAFLATALDEERRSVGPWAALALGVLARNADDDEARSTLRASLQHVANPEERGAWLLALGIARDAEAVPLAREALASQNQLTRMHAALSLGMIGDEPARAALLAALAQERSDLVRVGLVHALGAIGDPRDGELLVAALRELRNPELRAVMAVALAFHGSREVVEGLFALCDEDELSPASRAAAWDALGMLLALEPGLQLAALSRQSDFTSWPDWVLELLQVTL